MLYEIHSLVFNYDESYFLTSVGRKVDLDYVTDKAIIDLCFNKKSKVLKPLTEIMKTPYFYVTESVTYQHPLKGRARYGVYVIQLLISKLAPKKYKDLEGLYVLSYNDNVVLKVRN